jgi:hypothetical protein
MSTPSQEDRLQALKHPPDVNVSKQPKAKAGWEWLSDFLLEGVHNIANQSIILSVHIHSLQTS